MLGTVDARVAAKKTSAAKGAEWLGRMTVDATFWPKVNKRCVPQEDRKKKGDVLKEVVDFKCEVCDGKGPKL